MTSTSFNADGGLGQAMPDRFLPRCQKGKGLSVLRVGGVLLLLGGSAAFAEAAAAPVEANVEVASGWWPEMENTWVPIGWKDHRAHLRFFGGRLGGGLSRWIPVPGIQEK